MNITNKTLIINPELVSEATVHSSMKQVTADTATTTQTVSLSQFAEKKMFFSVLEFSSDGFVYFFMTKTKSVV